MNLAMIFPLIILGYGIGAPQNSPWINLVSNAILQLKSYGELSELYKKWWKTEFNKAECTLKMKRFTNVLGVSKLGGVFLIVAVFLIASILISIIEFIWKAKHTTKKVLFLF